MTRGRGTFDDRLTRLEDTRDTASALEEDEVERNIYAHRDDEGVYRRIRVFLDEAGAKFYGWMTGEGKVERLASNPPSKGGKAKFSTSGTTPHD